MNIHYVRLLAMTVLSFISMYVLMYAMVDRLANVYPNFNQFYMAGLMAAPMILIELILMGEMYHNKTLNVIIGAAAILAATLFFVFIRQQTAIADRQWLHRVHTRSYVSFRSGMDSHRYRGWAGVWVGSNHLRKPGIFRAQTSYDSTDFLRIT